MHDHFYVETGFNALKNSNDQTSPVKIHLQIHMSVLVDEYLINTLIVFGTELPESDISYCNGPDHC